MMNRRGFLKQSLAAIGSVAVLRAQTLLPIVEDTEPLWKAFIEKAGEPWDQKGIADIIADIEAASKRILAMERPRISYWDLINFDPSDEEPE